MTLQLNFQFVIPGLAPRCKVVSMSYHFEIPVYRLL